MQQLTPIELRAVDLLHRQFTRSTDMEKPSADAWASWADEVIATSDLRPPEWLCDLSLGETDRALTAWLRPVLGGGDATAGAYMSLRVGVWYLLFQAGRLPLDDLVGATAVEYADGEAIAPPTPGWEEFDPLLRAYVPERALHEQPSSWPAQLSSFFEPHAERVRAALPRLAATAA